MDPFAYSIQHAREYTKHVPGIEGSQGVGSGLLEYSQPMTAAFMASLVQLRVVSLYMRQTQKLALEAPTSYWEHVLWDLSLRTRMRSNVVKF
jgi:hypothetical protein